MGLGNSFAVLVVAEMLGVKAGLGWYLQWAQGWAAYANMYAALLLMAFLCSGLITLLFRLRDRLLSCRGSGAVVAATAGDYSVRGSTLMLREVSHRAIEKSSHWNRLAKSLSTEK